MTAPDRPATGAIPFFTIRGGRGTEALAFYSRSFAGEVIERTRGEDGKRLRQASLKLSNGLLMLTDALLERGHNPGRRNALHRICNG